ncbi:MAG TPA: ROK family protein [Acidiphilium sp.]|uniref:ROK family protein n=1 Tax=unclassified Acidiphilium TaxID=2617493 RepID=UPI000BC6A3C1|nr:MULTISPECIES: ROK family protein [unclassified Acidiphilium]OYV55987.1 MAG: fructokinase [Acidiphilium sp. 20-67-58]OYV85711.1 MAG: fructokinase [Acidiphilium sp. 21-68-69]HQT61973.1 ROK family protein [Acidiphilium sp.]HQU09960.1 ROK family protein [Acidiphilium sp.]
MTYRIGIDLGGTKIEIAALMPDGSLAHRKRVPTPQDYGRTIETIAELVREAEAQLGTAHGVGIGIPGTISPATGLVKNANSERLNGNPFDKDLETKLGRPVRVSNDANCFAMSEAADGAGAGAHCVFGVIIGTGCGGGIVVDGKVLEGRHHIAGEWGHTPLPWPRMEEMPLRRCWCGKSGCLETYIAGPALAAEADGPGARDAGRLPARAAAGEERAIRALATHAERLARGLAMIVNILDPDVIVLGGGLSNLDHLYTDLPRLMKPYIISDTFDTPVVRNKHGDSSGVRGAAWLWPAP